MFSEQVMVLAQRLCFAAPLLYVGVALVVDPLGLTRSCVSLARAMEELSDLPWQNSQWRRRLRNDPLRPPELPANLLRTIGGLMAAAAVCFIAMPWMG